MCLRFKVNYRIRFIISFDFESICTRELDKLLQATQSYLMISQEYVLDVFVYSGCKNAHNHVMIFLGFF